MRRSLPLLVLLMTTATACSGLSENDGSRSAGGSEASTDMVSDANSAMDTPAEMTAPRDQALQRAGPEIGPGTAPSVAFNYRYSFRLEAERVAQAQQEHQRLCERYTLNRCRITGMVYRAVNDRDVEAMLAFRVDPMIAGQFGRESVQSVLNAEGSLADSEITGTDVGSEATGPTLAELTAQLERVEARIRAAGPDDKGQLEAEAEILRQQIRDLHANRDEQAGSLATTPILFRYGSGDLAPGPAAPPTLGEAARETADDFLWSLNLLLILLVRLLPWAVAAALIWGVVRVLRRRFAVKPLPDAIEPATGA